MDVSLGSKKGYDLVLTNGRWRKSTRSGGNSDMCKEVAVDGGTVLVNNTNTHGEPPLVFDAQAWDAGVGAWANGTLVVG